MDGTRGFGEERVWDHHGRMSLLRATGWRISMRIMPVLSWISAAADRPGDS